MLLRLLLHICTIILSFVLMTRRALMQVALTTFLALVSRTVNFHLAVTYFTVSDSDLLFSHVV